MFSCLPARATFVADIKFVFEKHKMFLISFKNNVTNVYPFARPRKHHKQHVSATMCQTCVKRFVTEHEQGKQGNWFTSWSHVIGM